MSLLALFMCLFFVVPRAEASKPIAEITAFKGEVIVLSGSDIIEVSRLGQTLLEGDRVQTKEGQASITFQDGAQMKIRPHASVLIQEREEESGWWVFKTKKLVRRMTCYVGTLWFKSGASKRKNYLQSPTAVCGIRGSAMDFGFDNVMTYINEIEGSADKKGEVRQVTQAFFQNLQQNAQKYASANKVFNKVNDAYNKDKKAKATGKAEDQAEAKVATLGAVKDSIEELLKNENLSKEARDILNKALENVKKDLDEAEKTLKQTKEAPSTVTTEAPPPTTEPPPPTTVPPPPTTLPPPPTTTTVPVTTTTHTGSP